ncbi:MAG: hypothetical protein CMI18_07110 [Opitutaceae bacterium]|nr:hypothetical protein [Opitutaceae bacterium]
MYYTGQHRQTYLKIHRISSHSPPESTESKVSEKQYNSYRHQCRLPIFMVFLLTSQRNQTNADIPNQG